MNHPGKIFLLISACLSAAQLLCAGELEERALGDRAFYADDYHTAASHYRSARKLSDDSIISEAWMQNSLRLGRALLFAGDINGARQVLKEFRKRHPMRSAGTLPADILLAEGKYAEAEKIYRALENSGDEEFSVAARFGRGALAIKTGKLKDAETIFSGLIKDDLSTGGREPAHREAAMRELAYTLIHSRREQEALKLLAAVPAEKRSITHDILTAIAEIKSGNLQKFHSNWQQLISRQLRQPDARSYELLTAAAALAEKQNDPALSIELLKSADRFAPTTALRQDIFRRLINLQSKTDPEGAAETARQYRKNFPDSADRYDVQLATAAILADAKKFTAAAELLKELTLQKDVPQKILYRAAVNGAIFAESAGNMATAAWFHQVASRQAASGKEQLNSAIKYADFLLRQHDYRGAVAILEQNLNNGSQADIQAVKFKLLDAAVKAGDRKIIRQMADQLTTASEPRFRSRAHFERGELAANSGKFADARKAFLLAAEVKNAGEYAVAGKFAAAWMAFQLGDYRSAGEEGFRLAVEHPELPHAHQALFLGYRAGRQLNDETLKKKCADLLKKQYSNSESFAVYALQNASDRAHNERDLTGAIADLEDLERQFAGKPAILTEAMIMRANILKNAGKYRESMECASALLAGHPASRAAYNAALLAGNICFSQKKLPEALKYFQQATAMRPAGLEHDIANALAVETMLRMSISNTKLSGEAISNADRFIGKTGFPALRIKIRYLRAWALEHSGKTADALAGYEQLLNEGAELRTRGTPFDLNYCIKGAVAALQLVNSSNRRSLYVRGLRIIRQCRTLDLDSSGLDTVLLQDELIKKLSNKNRRR